MFYFKQKTHWFVKRKKFTTFPTKSLFSVLTPIDGIDGNYCSAFECRFKGTLMISGRPYDE